MTENTPRVGALEVYETLERLEVLSDELARATDSVLVVLYGGGVSDEGPLVSGERAAVPGLVHAVYERGRRVAVKLEMMVDRMNELHKRLAGEPPAVRQGGGLGWTVPAGRVKHGPDGGPYHQPQGVG